jgi:FkbM family methyltransferase
MTLSTVAKFAIQRTLRRRGWEIRRYELSEMTRLAGFLRQHRIDCVLDVGANVGQFAVELRTSGYTGRIISFEPQSDAHARLAALSESDPLWQVAPRSAVGSAAGEIEMNISENSVSSSALPILDTHTGSAPQSRYVRTEKAPVIRIDECDLIERTQRIFMKVDTQGFEQHVLDGATTLLPTLRGVQLEMSLAPLYAGQADFHALIGQLMQGGFEPWYISPGFEDRETGRLLQADVTMFRPE